uniref:SRCR domain-containing protein n=1 Tax=Erpetoichthys calabaricus TaxID=27687 RepID=A0A8C4RCM1_ERPCA
MKFNTNIPKPCSEDIAQEHCSGELTLSYFLRFNLKPTDLRLVGETNNCSGRVEVKYGDTWGTVCDDDWDLKDVQVVCRQLLCGEAVSAKLEFGGGSGVIWLNKVKCRGTETHLWDCQHEPLGKNDCEHKEDAGRLFLPPARRLLGHNQDVRLMDGGRACEGRVEVFYNEEWGTVCDDYWDLNDAVVVCRQLGCGDALLAPTFAHFGEGAGKIVLDDVSCTGEESALNMCASRQWGSSNCNHKEDASVVCSGRTLMFCYSFTTWVGTLPGIGSCPVLRVGKWMDGWIIIARMILLNGSSPCSGRLEVFHQSVCEANFDQMAAEVVCRELKCGAPKQFGGGMFGRGSDSVLLRKVQCVGDETQIINCISPNSTADSCTRRNHVGIVCVRKLFFFFFARLSIKMQSFKINSQNLVLVNGSNSCSGRVEFYYNGQWGTVCDHYWDLQDANVFCNQIGCGYAIKAPGQARFGEGHGEIWRDNLQCEGNEADLTKCPVLDYGREECTHRNDAGIICSGECF